MSNSAPPPPYGPPPSWQPPSGPPPPPGPPHGPSWGPYPGQSGPPRRSRGTLVVVLAVVAVLLVGAAGTGFVVWQGRDDSSPSAGGDPSTDPTSDPTADPTADPTEPADPTGSPSDPPAEPTDPVEPTGSPDGTGPDEGGPDGGGLYGGGSTTPPAEPDPTIGPLSTTPLSYREFERDWDFQLDDVKLRATFRSGVDHADCRTAERSRALTRIGCADAVEWTYRALDGDLALTHLVLTMRTPAEAARAVDDGLIKERSWKLRPESFLADRPGAWKADDVGQFVVITVVTRERSVSQARADRYLGYANTDVTGALAFRL